MDKNKAETDISFRPADLVDQRDLVNLAKNERKVGARASTAEEDCDPPNDPEERPVDAINEDHQTHAEQKSENYNDLPARAPASYFMNDDFVSVELEVSQGYDQAPASSRDEVQPSYPNRQDWNDEESKASPARPDPRCLEINQYIATEGVWSSALGGGGGFLRRVRTCGPGS